MLRIKKIDYQKVNNVQRTGYLLFDSNKEADNIEDGFCGKGVIIRRQKNKYNVYYADGFYNCGLLLAQKSTEHAAQAYAHYVTQRLLQEEIRKAGFSKNKKPIKELEAAVSE
jgi:hypothetical protein